MKTAAALLLTTAALTACTPDELALFAWVDAQPIGCHQAVDRYFPAHARPWAHRIVNRESGGDPGAQNTRSTAAGCGQLLRMHAWRFDAVGCSWARRYEARCNVRAMHHLWQDAGTAPWN